MAEQQKRKVIKGTSPVGMSSWFKLVHPDQKFKKYQVDLVLEDSEAVRKLIEQAEVMAQEALAEEKKKVTEKKNAFEASKLEMSKNKPIVEQRDSEGNPTGKFVMKIRNKSEGTDKEKKVYKIAPPMIIQPSGKPYSKIEAEALKVPNGSLIQIGFELKPYCNAAIGAGCTITAVACKIIKLQSAADISQFAFAEGELDSEAPDTADSADFESGAAGSEADGADF